MVDVERIQRVKDIIAVHTENVRYIKGVNNLFFTVLMITEGQVPEFLPERYEDFFASLDQEAIQDMYNNMACAIEVEIQQRAEREAIENNL